MDLDPEWSEAIRLHDLIEITGWTLEQIETAPTVVLDRLLSVHEATTIAQQLGRKGT